MSGKPNLKPSLLLEVTFMLAVWLSAWLIFHASRTIIIVVIFSAYGLVFLYENWIDGLAKRERSKLRRSSREAVEHYGGPELLEQSPPPPDLGVSEIRRAELEVSTQPILERLVAELHGRDVEREAVPPPEVITAEAARARERAERAQAERERAEKERAERDQAERERTERERVESERSEPETAERAAVKEPLEPEPEPKPEPAPEPEVSQERRSLMAAIAAAPGETLRTHAIGGWNIWQLERMMAARSRRDEKSDYERSLMLVYLREFADSDGQLPPTFDELVRESFGDLVRGPVIP